MTGRKIFAIDTIMDRATGEVLADANETVYPETEPTRCGRILGLCSSVGYVDVVHEGPNFVVIRNIGFEEWKQEIYYGYGVVPENLDEDMFTLRNMYQNGWTPESVANALSI